MTSIEQRDTVLPSPPETRASLILRLHDAADVAAWDEFVAIYGPVVFRMATQQGLQPADAENLAQEVFAAVARSVEQWLEREDRGSFRSWLLRIARNLAVNLLTRRSSRTLGTGGEEAEQLLAELPACETNVSSQFDIEYRREVFAWAADQVRESVAFTTWQSFWLTRVEGISIAEAAQQVLFYCLRFAKCLKTNNKDCHAKRDKARIAAEGQPMQLARFAKAEGLKES